MCVRTSLDTHQIDADGIVFTMYECIKGLTILPFERV